MTRMFVDAWDPSYGASFEGDGGDGPASPSSAQVDTDVEVPAAEWAPIDAGRGVRCPDMVLLVDGVRRNDAGLWTEEEDGNSYAGLAASYAAGVVRCDLRNGVAELAGARVARGLFTASPSAGDLLAGSVRYEIHRVNGTGEASKLPAAVQAPLTALEIEVSRPPATTARTARICWWWTVRYATAGNCRAPSGTSRRSRSSTCRLS